MVLAVATLCSGEAAKKSKKSEKATLKSKVPKQTNEKNSKPHKRGLYPDPILGSTYAIPGVLPVEDYHGDPEDFLSADHDIGVYGGVYAQHIEAPAVVATYAPQYGFSDCDVAKHNSYTTYGHGYLGGFPGGLSGLEALLGGVRIEEGTIKVRTITTHVPVPVPHPVPVEVIKKVPVEVREEVPVDVPRAVRVEVPQPYPVEVEKPYPVEVIKPVPTPVPVPVHYAVPTPYPVEVPAPYAVEVHKPVPVAVPHEIEVVKPIPVAHASPVHPNKHVLFHTTPKPYVASPTVIPVHPTTPAPLVTVTKCDEGLHYPEATSFPSFAHDLFSVSSFKSLPHSTPAPTYSRVFTPSPGYSTVTPIPKIIAPVTPVPAYSTAVVPITPKLVTKVHSYPTVVPSYTPAPPVYPSGPSYNVAPVYSTPAPIVAYPTPSPSVPVYSQPKIVVPAPTYTPARIAPVYSTPAPVVAYPTPSPAAAAYASYPKVAVAAPAYPTPYPHVASYPASEPCDHSYLPSNPVPAYSSYNPSYSAPPPSYNYGSGVATSFVGMSSHGSSAYGGGYRSEIHHPQYLRQSY